MNHMMSKFSTVVLYSIDSLSNDESFSLQNAPFNPSMFGTTLEEVMEMQEDLKPDLRVPWVVITLTETVLRLNGPLTEGIFR